MLTLKTFIARSPEIRQRAAAWIVDESPDDCIIRVIEPGKTRLQEERYHAMIGDIAKQWKYVGMYWDAESMKRLLVDQFRRDTARDEELAALWKEFGHVEMAPSIDGSGVVALGVQTRKFSKRLASAFTEWLFAFGAEREIKWSNKVK